MDTLQKIKSHSWFYEFTLPDGSKTKSYLSDEVAKIHTTREKVLREFLSGKNHSKQSALDVSCHEGFFSVVLSDYFKKVVGIDKNTSSLDLARQMGTFLKKDNISFEHYALEDVPLSLSSDFVLCYGLIYHIENPLYILRKLAELSKNVLCIETQVLPFSMNCQIEDGHYLNQRPLKGLFGLCPDYPESKEGGLTQYALVPSKDAIVYLLKEFGFTSIQIYKPNTEDYEQFIRGSRIILFATK